MTDISQLLKRHGIQANKSLGQNFLHKTDIIENIAKNAAGSDCVLEIGAGPGVLSKHLCGSFKKVVTIEIDRSLEPVTREVLEGCKNHTMVYADFLKINLNNIINKYLDLPPVTVVGNLPYNITGQIITKLIKNHALFDKAVIMIQKEAAQKVVEQTAAELGCMLTIADVANAKHVKYGLKKQTFDYGNYKKLEITLAGKFQVANAVLAVEAVQALGKCGYEIKETAIRKGLKETVWNGRLQILEEHPLFIVDGAHNEDAAAKLADSIEFYFTNKRIIYIMGMLKDKEVDRVIALTEKYADQILTVTPPDNPRAMHAYDLATEVAKVHPNVTAVDSLEEAVELSHLLAGRDDVVLCFGSLSYLGRILKLMEKRQTAGNKRKAKR